MAIRAAFALSLNPCASADENVDVPVVLGATGATAILVPENIVLPPSYLGLVSSAELAGFAKIALTVVLLALAIELKVSPFLTVTFSAIVYPKNPKSLRIVDAIDVFSSLAT